MQAAHVSRPRVQPKPRLVSFRADAFESPVSRYRSAVYWAGAAGELHGEASFVSFVSHIPAGIASTANRFILGGDALGFDDTIEWRDRAGIYLMGNLHQANSIDLHIATR
jgi:hypothetical protein